MRRHQMRIPRNQWNPLRPQRQCLTWPFWQHLDALPGKMRKLLTRLDSQHYTNTLEKLLREKGVDVDALQSKYFYSKVKLDGDTRDAGHAFQHDGKDR